MTKIGCENGFVRMANQWFDEFLKVRITASEMVVFLAIVRHTYGFNRKYGTIPFESATGLPKRTIRMAIAYLLESKMVVCAEPPVGPYPGKYGPNKNYLEWSTRQSLAALPGNPLPPSRQSLAAFSSAISTGTKARSTPKDNFKDRLLKTPPPTPQGASVVVEISPGGDKPSKRFSEILAGSIVGRIEDAFGPVAPRYQSRILEASKPPSKNPKTWARLLKERFFAHIDYTKSAWSVNPGSVKSPIGLLVARLIADSAILRKESER